MPVPREHDCRPSALRPTEEIGTSFLDRPIAVIRTGDPESNLRILILGGQHGDEREARRTVERLARRDPSRVPLNVQLAMIPSVNPDGAAAHRRRNAQNIDLNRDHLTLQTPELVALHAFVRTWRPHLILDVHTYPARRKHLLRNDLIYCHDLFLDLPTHPAIELACGNEVMQRGLENVLGRIDRDGIRAARYTLIRKSGKARHSTCDIVDARNQLALRYGIPTLLLEGRHVSRRHEPSTARRHVRRAMLRAMDHVVDWAVEHREALTTRQALDQDSVPVGARHEASTHPLTMPFRIASTGAVESVSWPGPYLQTIAPARPVRLPVAYGVPNSCREVIELLDRHGFKSVPAAAVPFPSLVGYRIRSVEPARRKGGPLRKVRYDRTSTPIPLHDLRLFPTAQEGGRALAVYLEPNSKYGLARFPSMGLAVQPGSLYPIARCESCS